MSQPGHSHTVIIDKGSSTPANISHQISIPIPPGPSGAIPIAEFGLAVEQGTISNFVTLSGHVNVAAGSPFPAFSLDIVVLRVVRRNTTSPSAPVTIFETQTGLFGGGKPVNAGILFTDGGVGKPIPTGYYSYVLTVHKQQGSVQFNGSPTPAPFDDSSPIVIGPIQFEGTSYTTNTSSVGLN